MPVEQLRHRGLVALDGPMDEIISRGAVRHREGSSRSMTCATTPTVDRIAGIFDIHASAPISTRRLCSRPSRNGK
jgi:hypothetical protein